MDEGERFIEALSQLQEVTEELTAEEAADEFEEATLQVFWREWPLISEWAGMLWRRLQTDLAEPAKPVRDTELDETGGEG